MTGGHFVLLVLSFAFPPLALFVVADIIRKSPNPALPRRTHYPKDW